MRQPEVAGGYRIPHGTANALSGPPLYLLGHQAPHCAEALLAIAAGKNERGIPIARGERDGSSASWYVCTVDRVPDRDRGAVLGLMG